MNLPARNRLIAVQCAILIIFPAALFFGFYLPQYAQFRLKQVEIRDLAARIGQIGMWTQNIPDIEAELGRARSRSAKFGEYFPSQNNMSRVIQSLSDLLNSHGLKVMSLLPGGVESMDGAAKGLVKTTFNVELAGTYRDFGVMIGALRRMECAIFPAEMEIARSGGPGQVRIKLVVNAYLRKAD